jgi:putative transposase
MQEADEGDVIAANERRRFGYRRLAVMLKRDGRLMNLKKGLPALLGRSA